mmetsp:Transcript_8425/g.23772  ORF Transcript_8425/g.23772 Transcript_8425/m.23772 type:complete len:297 (-) Transcript_8425:141-1031(-)
MTRCVIGGKDAGPAPNDFKYLQFLNGACESVAKDRWINLGFCTSVELWLTFADPDGINELEKPSLGIFEAIHFELARVRARRKAAAPDKEDRTSGKVCLNIFDLNRTASVTNQLLCNPAFQIAGLFHAAIEVYGKEWSFYKTPDPCSCGIFQSNRARHHSVHIYRETVELGFTQMKVSEVKRALIQVMAPNWTGSSYDLIHKNCIHFCQELAKLLGVDPVPSWVCGLHELGATVLFLPWPLNLLFESEEDKMKRRALAELQAARPPEDGILLHSDLNMDIVEKEGALESWISVQNF